MSDKIKQIFEQLIKFGIVGIITTAISTIVNILLLKFNMFYIVAYTISYAIGIIVSYFLNSIFVFKQKLEISRFIKFATVYLVSYFIGLINIMIMVEKMSINEIVATIINVCIMTLLNFVFVKIVAFKKNKDNEDK